MKGENTFFQFGLSFLPTKIYEWDSKFFLSWIGRKLFQKFCEIHLLKNEHEEFIFKKSKENGELLLKDHRRPG